MKPEIAICIPYNPDQVELFRELFTVHHAPTDEEMKQVVAKSGKSIRAVVTSGSHGLAEAYMDAMPALEIVALRGAGFDNMDLAAARNRGITVFNCPGVNYFAVSEHAVALLLALVRRIPDDNEGVRQGKWREHKAAPLRGLVYRKKIGIIGLGKIGKAIAERLLPFEVEIAYHNRTRREDVPYRYVDTAEDLARFADMLVISAPGGPDTRGLVSDAVLEALGPKGYLVNVGRGSIVDQNALVERLRSGGLAGAALDVVDGEPEMPQGLLDLRNVIVTPHIAGNAPESRFAGIEIVRRSFEAKFAGEPIENVLT